MKLLAIDPGNVYSGWVMFNTKLRIPEAFGKDLNKHVLRTIQRLQYDRLFCEFPVPRGQSISIQIPGKGFIRKGSGQTVSWQLYETCYWIGQFQVIHMLTHKGVPFIRINRMDVKMFLTGNAGAKDANVRAAIMEKYGGKELAVGNVKKPGPLHGMKADVWQSLAIALYVEDGQFKTVEDFVIKLEKNIEAKKAKKAAKKLKESGL
jgi:hypothetical protein